MRILKGKKYKTKKSAATSAYEKRFGKKNESDGPGAIPEPVTKLASQDPETGRVSWDVSYDVKPKELYKRVDDLVKFLERAKGNPELDGIRLSLRNLRAKISRLMTQGKL